MMFTPYSLIRLQQEIARHNLIEKNSQTMLL